ncbi:MAG TPA: BTAD domain-containing putative transcriptional regulator [Pyrinomonadaceae bacterium]|nr:BTAD domain-containing putative transcriptional regulator [Pyrinomonadaceae bacterium]
MISSTGLQESVNNRPGGVGRAAELEPQAGPPTTLFMKETPLSQPAFFLRTKLLPPRPAPALLSRPRLSERLERNLEHPVTLVTANAGSGKTTLVADFVRSGQRQYVWYQLDHTDADPAVFLGYVTNGIRQTVKGFGEVMLSYLQQASDELAQQPERAVDVLLNEVLEKIEQQLVIVLDDYHHLGTDTAVHRVVDRLIQYMPDVMHLIIITRDLPPLSIARLRSHNSLAVIDRSELLFTDKETQELFRQVFDLELTPEQLKEYRERTHGWITALQLVRQVAQRQALSQTEDGGAGAIDLVDVLRQSERDIFDYFAEEVFADEPEDVRLYLPRLALLDRIESSTCHALFPEANCRNMLPALVRRNVFTSIAADERGEEYRLHPLFQSFLRRRLRAEIGRAGVASEHARFADHFLKRAVWDEAMQHLLAAEDYERAASIIAEEGSRWITSGALSSLISYSEALPASVLESRPRALLHRAEAARLQGEYDTAQSLFRRAVQLLHEREDREWEAEGLHSLATIARRRGEFETAFSYLDRAVELTDEGAPVRMKCGNTRGLCLMATGELEAAEREFRAALQLAEEQGEERYSRLIAHNLGLPAMIRGDFGEALRWLRRILPETNAQPPAPQEATAHLNIARCYFYRGDMASCEKHLDEALERSQLFNQTSLHGEIFESYGNLYRETGDVARATEFYERASRAHEESGIDITRHELLDEQAVLYLQVGDLQAAREKIDRLIDARERAGDQLGMTTASLVRASIMLAEGNPDGARSELLPALSYFREHRLNYYEAQASMALASCEYRAGDESKALEHLRRAVDLAARYDYEYWLKRQVERHRELFSNAEAAEVLPTDLRALLAAAPQTKEPEVAQASPITVVSQKPVTDLTINMLGPVEIFRDPARPLAADAWTTKRARDILCYIASRRHRRASKDVIIDTFWSDADFEVVEKNFHPTISHIRKALNSNQPLKQNFLVYRDGDYQLNQNFSYLIDTAEFDRLLSEGESARRAREFERCIDAYENAIKLYRGEFMQGGYDDWVEEQRTYYREQYLRILESLAAVAQRGEDWLRVLDLAQQILREDPFREDIHCMIMRAYSATGNRAALKEQYEHLRKLLQKELGVEPVAETRKVYKELMG